MKTALNRPVVVYLDSMLPILRSLSFTFIFFVCCYIHLNGQCSFTVDAGPDLKVCNPGDMIMINGKITGSVQEIYWEPATGLSNPRSPVTKATVSGPIEYILTAKGLSNINLITNGNFEAGRTGFYTDYVVGSTPCYGAGYLDCEGTYDVINNPQLGHTAWAPCGDHTSGSGLMMVLNGAAAFQNVWCQVVNVMPDMDYVFTAWVTSVISSSPPILQFSINGTSIGPVFNSSGTPCLWEKYEVTWNSGSNTSAEICILNENTATGGNDFAIDDISFRKICEIKDTMKIEVEELIVEIEEPPVVTCDNPRIRLNAKGSSTGPGWKYQWTTSDGKIISGGTTLEPLIEGPGIYYLTVCSPLPNCCKSKEILVMGNIKPPDLRLSVKDTIGCNNPAASIISNSRTFPIEYEWSGPNGFSSSDPVVVVTSGGMYVLTITDDYNCKTVDSIFVVELQDNPKISIQSNSINCKFDTANLIGSSSVPGSTFEWFGPNMFYEKNDSIHVLDSGIYVLKVVSPSGCIKTDSIKISKDIAPPFLNYTADTISCLKDTINIQVFSPHKLINTNWSSNQNFNIIDSLLIQTSSGGLYVVKAISENFCEDSLLINVITDTLSPGIDPKSDTLNCIKTSVTLHSGNVDNTVIVSWTNPGGSTFFGDSLRANKPGFYQLTATGKNGCSVHYDIELHQDTIHPQLNTVDDTLNCKKRTAILNLQDLYSSSYKWSGPNAFTSNQKNPQIDQPGNYQVIAQLTNGCMDTASVLISSDFALPLIQYRDDTLNCKKDSLVLQANADKADAVFEWSGPGGFSSVLNNPVIKVAGIYNLIVTNSNGCADSVQINIQRDVRIPSLSATPDTLNCIKRTAHLLAQSNRDSLMYLWSGPNQFSSTDSSVIVTQGGVYTISIESPEGCKSILNVEIVEDTIKPHLQLFTDTLNCLKTMITLNYTSPEQIITQQWNGPGGFNSTQTSPITNQAGYYTISITSDNFCISTDSVYISIDTIKPIVQFSDDSINCLKRSVQFNAIVQPNNLTGSWTLPNQQIINSNSISSTLGGNFTFHVIGKNYCQTSVNTFVKVDTIPPDASVSSDSITCASLSSVLNASSLTNGVSYNWTGPAGFTSSQKNNIVTIPGNYQLIVRSSNGCESLLTVLIPIDTIHPSITTSADSIDCSNLIAELRAFPVNGKYNYNWFDAGGMNISNMPVFKTSNGGLYSVEVIDPSNGCQIIVEQLVKEDSLIIRDVIISSTDPVCDALYGQMSVVKVIGGHAGLQFSVDRPNQFTNQTEFDQLKSGKYTLYIKDEKDCRFQKDFFIYDIPFVETALPPELRIDLGDSAQLNLNILPDPAIIKSILWRPQDYLSCYNCTSPMASPPRDTEFEVTVVDTNGCLSTSRIIVRVDLPQVWVPNAFSPNGDQINDWVFVHGSDADVTRINIFQIFDRWGNSVFENKLFAPNDFRAGWNGRYRDEKCLPGVYVYWAEVELSNGTKWIVKGDITLLR